ncbi:MAG: halocarboxylic acid dehydrogenase DehI family protein [Terriglobales bacterium]
MKEALGLPNVGVVHQAFAVYPDFLKLHWRIFRPVTESQQLFDLADRLRADAYTRIFTYLDVPDLGLQDPSMGRELMRVTELSQYQNSLLLLIAAAQYQAFEGPVGSPVAPDRVAARHPLFDTPLPAVDEHRPPAQVRPVLEKMRRGFGEPFIAPDYLALASWPEFFAAYWAALKNCMQSPLYQGCHHNTRETAWMLARELPGPFELTYELLAERGIAEEDVSSLVRITEMFVDNLSRTLLNTAIARIGLEGGGQSAVRKPTEAVQAPGEERAA